MVPQGIAKRYATALFNAALNKNIAGDIHEEAEGLRTLLEDNPSFKRFLLSPQILTEDKKQVLKSSFEGRSSPLFVEFLMLLIDKKRFPFIDEIIEAYNYLYEHHEGVMEVQSITAVPIDSRMEDKLRKRLADATGKQIRLTPQVDPAIIGGIILVMEDKIIDGSVRFQMEKLKRQLDEIRV